MRMSCDTRSSLSTLITRHFWRPGNVCLASVDVTHPASRSRSRSLSLLTSHHLNHTHTHNLSLSISTTPLSFSLSHTPTHTHTHTFCRLRCPPVFLLCDYYVSVCPCFFFSSLSVVFWKRAGCSVADAWGTGGSRLGETVYGWDIHRGRFGCGTWCGGVLSGKCECMADQEPPHMCTPPPRLCPR